MVALGLSLILITVRQNARINETTARHKAQLVEQTERFAAQVNEMTARHNAQIAAMAARQEKPSSMRKAERDARPVPPSGP
ncbi:hypothetical protein ACYOEI_13750 [Singulisphaera rosea]